MQKRVKIGSETYFFEGFLILECRILETTVIPIIKYMIFNVHSKKVVIINYVHPPPPPPPLPPPPRHLYPPPRHLHPPPRHPPRHRRSPPGPPHRHDRYDLRCRYLCINFKQLNFFVSKQC